VSTITFHGSPGPGGRPGSQPRTGAMSSRDPVVLNRAAKQLIQSGHWRRQIANDDRLKVLMSLKARLPFAVGHIHVDGMLALTKRPEPGCCYWCSALMIRDPDLPELVRDAANFALLGPGCQRCRTRWETAAVAAREQALQAAGYRRLQDGRLQAPNGEVRLRRVGVQTAVRSYYNPNRRRRG
jgi:hypothetical protein